jgi:hypothetical protein
VQHRLKSKLLLVLWATLLAGKSWAISAVLFVDTAKPGRHFDLACYGLGQGGLSVSPMFDDHVEEIARLHPQTIRLFVQEYFNLYPDHGVYHWDTLDQNVQAILATGARPLMCLCFKPRTLYPHIDQDVVNPTDYGEWETFISSLVRHCNQEKNYGISYWEVGNEVDIGESGGCPYRFQPGDYTNYYARTARAIRRADPAAKVGGPALANYTSAIGDALIALGGTGGAPLDFFSWHVYSSNPNASRASVTAIRQKLARFPVLAATETIIDEWNMNLLGNEPATGFQAAFVLEATAGFFATGLSRAAYYHIRDHTVVPEDFAWMSPGGYKFMADWWNVQIQNSGLFDKEGRRRPAYFSFQMLGNLRGRQLPVAGTNATIHAFAVQQTNTTQVVFWNFGSDPANVTLTFPSGQPGRFRLDLINAASNRLDTVRRGLAGELDANPLLMRLPAYGAASAQLGEL